MSIPITRIPTDGSAAQTGVLMHEMVRRYYRDMMPYAKYSLGEIFDIVKSIPFREDPYHEETLQRPAHTMLSRAWGGDCDDKSICLASWAVCNDYPYEFIACRAFEKGALHHVYPEIFINGQWTICDATYPFNILGIEREAYAEKVII